MTENGPHPPKLFVGIYASDKCRATAHALQVYGYETPIFL